MMVDLKPYDICPACNRESEARLADHITRLMIERDQLKAERDAGLAERGLLAGELARVLGERDAAMNGGRTLVDGDVGALTTMLAGAFAEYVRAHGEPDNPGDTLDCWRYIATRTVELCEIAYSAALRSARARADRLQAQRDDARRVALSLWKRSGQATQFQADTMRAWGGDDRAETGATNDAG